MDNRPVGRKTNITGKGSVSKRGSGLGSGPVGNGGRGSNSGSGFHQTPQKPNQSRPSGNGTQRSSGNRGGRSPLLMIIIIVIALFGGGGGIFSFLGGSDSSTGDSTGTSVNHTISSQVQTGTQGQNSSTQGQSGNQGQIVSNSMGSGLSSWLFSSGSGASAGSTGGWTRTPNTGNLDRTVSDGVRAKRTVIKGDKQDTVTIMVYLCGTDLESKNGMATADLKEMINASLSEQVNIIVYTGGCAQWKNGVVSSDVNQIYQIKDGGLLRLNADAGRKSMTDPDTLSGFIKWCHENFPANREELIFWDHGGGSLSGYGYDEKNKNAGSMTLTGINKALKDAGVTFDFIGFDACLMATAETALMLEPYADYLIASEETEPGVGWYYTNWLTRLSQNTSMDTLQIGQNICDDFVSVCAQKCSGQKTTLSVIDLAELSAKLPEALSEFAKDTSDMIQTDEFKLVSDARYGAREFAQSSKIDQIDLVHFASNLNTEAGEKLCQAILGAVKYNKTSSNMTNAYGLSIYFPYKRASKVDSAVNTYKNIGMDTDYMRCIEQFASMEVSGQAAAGGNSTASPVSYIQSASSQTSVNSSAGYTVNGAQAISQLLSSVLGGSLDIPGLTSGNSGFFTGKALEPEQMAGYIADNQFDPGELIIRKNTEGDPVIAMSDTQWSLVHDLCLSVYYDDGEGYLDLGLDNVFEFDDEGNLLCVTDGSWLALNGQTVSYYYESSVSDGENYTIRGRIPAMLNGERVDLQVVFDQDRPNGYLAGASYVYDEAVTETCAKGMTELQDGDVLDFLCDYYTYNGEYYDSYYLGESMTLKGTMEEQEISNVLIDEENCIPMFRFTDIYDQIYWSDTF